MTNDQIPLTQEEHAEKHNAAYRLRWEAMRDAPDSKAEDVQIATLMLAQPEEDNQQRIDSEACIWARGWELRDLVADIHPGEDGGLMLNQLDAYASAESTKEAVSLLSKNLALSCPNKKEGSAATERYRAQIELAACEFWPLRSITGGNGQVVRLEWVEPHQPPPTADTITPTPEVAMALGSASDGSAKPGRTTRRTWRDIAWLYVVDTFKAGQYSTAKDLYRELEKKAGTDGSRFVKGTGAHIHSLYVREVSQAVSLKTIQNAWTDIKESR